jgi:membrane fusion protein, multidrug efflux system
VPVQIGTQVDKDFPFTGRLDYASPETSAETGTLAVRAVFANADRALLPGLFVRIRIPMGKSDALLLPDATIGTDQQGRFVLIVNKDGIIERRNVTLLDRSGDRQQVEGPLSKDDWIIANVAAAPRVGETVIRKQVTNDQSEANGATDPAAAAPQTK